MNNNGFSATKIIGKYYQLFISASNWSPGFEHNWSGATTYAVPLLQAAPNAFDGKFKSTVACKLIVILLCEGVSFHCYEGTVDEQLGFQTAFPDKEVRLPYHRCRSISWIMNG